MDQEAGARLARPRGPNLNPDPDPNPNPNPNPNPDPNQVLASLGREDVRSYKQEGALEQLWYVDAAYLAAVALANFMFPYILLPTALNPMQLMIPPNDVEIPLVAEK